MQVRWKQCRTLVLAGVLLGVMGRAAAGQGAPHEADASVAFAKLLGGMQVHRVDMRFICRKTVLHLETPLISGGRMWVGAAGGAGPVGQRFKTEWPYVSEFVWANGFVKARSQHERDWSTTLEPLRPGLTAVMMQMGLWATGSPGKGELFHVEATGDEIPPRPAEPGSRSNPAGVPAITSAGESFQLTPANKDLAASVKRVSLGFAGASTAPAAPVTLSYVRIVTAQDDVSEYWFYDQRVNAELPADIFEPRNAENRQPAAVSNRDAPNGRPTDTMRH